jgi:hypothetical protein
MAPKPLAKATAATALSSAASFSSVARTVGLPARLYESRACPPADRRAPNSTLCNRYVLDW